ncbi:MAG: hypothetical protein AAF610_00530 [Pseudomonadota bacterium]
MRATVTAVMAGLLFVAPQQAHAQSNVISDFNGDGYSDLLIGVPGKLVDGNIVTDNDQGAAFVAYSDGTDISFAGE